MKNIKRVLWIVGTALLLYIPVCREMKWTNSGNQAIGVIRIPEIQLDLPVYEGVSEEVLELGIGHIVESDLPGDGKGSRCLLAGHRGLPKAELFERLGEIKNGDLFYIEMGSHNYVYEVCSIEVILPNETETLNAKKEKELVSLITCTPYCINTHRLIVTGERKK